MSQLRFVFCGIKTHLAVKFSFHSHFASVQIENQTEMLKKAFTIFVVSLVFAEAVVVIYSNCSNFNC